MEVEVKNRQIHLRVLTPSRVVLDKPADIVIMHTTEGEMGVMYGHEPYSALLDYGTLRIVSGGQENEVLMVLGSIVTVSGNQVNILSEMAERPDKIQEAINKMKAERAANKLAEEAFDLNMHRAEMAIRRALVHIDVSAYSIVRGIEE